MLDQALALVARAHRDIPTFLRGPVLALNPSLADLLLVELLGVLAPLPLLAVEHLRERFLRELPATGGAFARR